MSAVRYPSLHGGRLCLDFCNTLDPRTPDRAHETLHGYDDLVGWSAYAAGLDSATAAALSANATAHPERAAGEFARAIAFREALYTVLAAIADRREPDPAALHHAGCEINSLPRKLRHDGTAFAWEWAGNPADLARPLWAIARSAEALLTSDELQHVKRCPGPGTPCNWLFLDESKNHSRVWCSMEGCGNLAKARRHLKRQRQTAGA